MFKKLRFVGYSKRILNYMERITLYNLTHMMSMVIPVAISMEILMINSECFLEKEFTELICMNQ